jgi:hypothetical protein
MEAYYLDLNILVVKRFNDFNNLYEEDVVIVNKGCYTFTELMDLLEEEFSKLNIDLVHDHDTYTIRYENFITISSPTNSTLINESSYRPTKNGFLLTFRPSFNNIKILEPKIKIVRQNDGALIDAIPGFDIEIMYD